MDKFFHLDSHEITADDRAMDFFFRKNPGLSNKKPYFVQKIFKNKFGNHEINKNNSLPQYYFNLSPK
jgi:hypothetical protein